MTPRLSSGARIGQNTAPLADDDGNPLRGHRDLGRRAAQAVTVDVLVADVTPNSPGSQAQIRSGDVISELNRSQGITVVMVTHEAEMADYARRTVTIRDGLIASDIRRDTRRAGMEVA